MAVHYYRGELWKGVKMVDMLPHLR
jgi:hypothetical protein